MSKSFLKLEKENYLIQTSFLACLDKYVSDMCLFHSGILAFSRDYCYYDHSLYVKHAISILEDLLITFADGIASMYLEFISVDSSFFDEVDNIGLALCTLSTRALQRLRNEVLFFFPFLPVDLWLTRLMNPHSFSNLLFYDKFGNSKFYFPYILLC